jgi:hypothetical protein
LGEETVSDIEIDPNGNIILSGYYSGTVDFDPGSGVHSRNSTQSFDPFVLKLDNSGNFDWVVSYDWTSTDWLYFNRKKVCLAIDDLGYIYVASTYTDSIDLDPGAGIQWYVCDDSSYSGAEGYISRLDPAGILVWAGVIEASFSGITGLLHNYTQMEDIEFGTDGSLMLVGHFMGKADFNIGPGVDTIVTEYGPGFYMGRGESFFHCKMDTSGNFQWVQEFPNDNLSDASGYTVNIEIASDNSIYRLSSFNITIASLDMDPGPGYSIIADNTLAKYDQSGSLLWGMNIVENVDEIGFNFSNFTMDRDDNIYLVGNFDFFGGGVHSFDIDPGLGIQYVTTDSTAGTTEYFLIILDSAGNFIWGNDFCEYADWPGIDETMGIHVDDDFNVYVSSYFKGSALDLDPTVGVAPYTSAGLNDGFITKIAQMYFSSATLVQMGNTLNAITSGDSYEWLDCNTQQIIPGITSQSFTPTQSGSYAVIVYNNGVADTSDCVDIIITGTRTPNLSEIVKVYPNPTSGAFQLELPQEISATDLEIIGIDGKVVHRQSIIGSSIQQINTPIPNGIYIIRVRNDRGVLYDKRIIVQH